ncbi:MAG: DUF3386 family protein [Thermomicrobiales bacterium]
MSSATAVRNESAAHDLLQTAHEQGYRFPEGFSGFSAEVTYEDPTTRSVGAVAVRAPRDVMLELDASEGVASWLRQEMSSMAGHRWPTTYEASDGRYALTLDGEANDPRGRLIQFHHDPFDSSYRIREGRIVQVNRRMGQVRFSINILEHVQTADGRLLPTYFTVSFWDVSSGRLTRADGYTDRYVVVDGVLLPESRRVLSSDDDGVTVRSLTLTAHQLLGGTGETKAARAERSNSHAG